MYINSLSIVFYFQIHELKKFIGYLFSRGDLFWEGGALPSQYSYTIFQDENLHFNR